MVPVAPVSVDNLGSASYHGGRKFNIRGLYMDVTGPPALEEDSSDSK
jgi:hypothetical protein